MIMSDNKNYTFSTVGKSVTRLDAIGKVTGKAIFGPDIQLPNLLYGKTLKSRYPHARIRDINFEEAIKLPGVKAIITAKDAPVCKFGINIIDQSIFARDKVRFQGDLVAAVAAVDEETAEKALQLIDVEYEELPAVFDPVEAMKPGAPLVHEGLHTYALLPLYGVKNAFKPIKGTNIAYHFKLRKGDVNKGFHEADFTFEDTLELKWLNIAQ